MCYFGKNNEQNIHRLYLKSRGSTKNWDRGSEYKCTPHISVFAKTRNLTLVFRHSHHADINCKYKHIISGNRKKSEKKHLFFTFQSWKVKCCNVKNLEKNKKIRHPTNSKYCCASQTIDWRRFYLGTTQLWKVKKYW